MNKNLSPLRRLVLGAALIGLAGCASLFTTAPRPLYRLTAPNDFPPAARPVTAQISIGVPYALDYLADGDWTDRVPALVQTELIEAFENSRAFKAVGPDSLDLRADLVVQGDLRHFEAVYDSASPMPVAWVALAVKLVKMPEQKILAESLITARETASANATPQIVLAFSAATGSVAKQVVAWVLANAPLPASRR
jgi:cholesterol transport system auxiliary component